MFFTKYKYRISSSISLMLMHTKFLLIDIFRWVKFQMYPLKIAFLFAAGAIFPLIIYARDVSSGTLALSFVIFAFITGFFVGKIDQHGSHR